MLRKISFVLTLAAALTALTSARAQQLDPATMSPEEQAMMEQLQIMGQTIQQNIANQNIDPAVLRQQFQESMTNGSDPMESIQQILIDQGLIGQDQLNQMFGAIRGLALSQIRRQLASTDEEWAVVEAKLQRVVVAMADAEQDQFGRLAGRFMAQGTNNTPMEKARRDLRAAVADPNVGIERLTIVLDTWRREHQRAKAELATARADLTNILTLRQEAVLLSIGVL
jgi:hypothetical protein